ncbi:zinc ribbon domain-containing protein [Pirellulaceae bacterium]|nr:zinc ribbon domain-containing protein [Pirellulaceae bacterium]MDB4640584.1 zinc ribbon domain-containing protein [Pirellulaceae bacterium]
MPIYEYSCQDCTSEFEVLVRGNEDAACPSCDSKQLEKRFSVTASPPKSGSSLPIATPESCGAPRCCGGGCN